MLSISAIAKHFDSAEKRIWTRSELLKELSANFGAWETRRISDDAIRTSNLSNLQILNAIVKVTQLKQVTLAFPYRSVARYVWKSASTFAILQAVDAAGYFSHYTAMQHHELTEQIPKAIYFNVEQPAAGGNAKLTQTGIDQAFGRKCRVTNNIIKFQNYTVFKINGKNTHRLGVVEAEIDGAKIGVTDLERTLIDIAVRPVYSGGVAEVANAFTLAAPRVSGNKLYSYLKAIKHAYPYHQVLGFYMSKAGNYSDAQMAKILAMPLARSG